MTEREPKNEKWNRRLENLKSITFIVEGSICRSVTKVEGTEVTILVKDMWRDKEIQTTCQLSCSQEELLAELRDWHMDGSTTI